MDYLSQLTYSTDFGVDSSRRSPFRARTDRQTDRQTRLSALPHAGGYTAGMGNFMNRLLLGQHYLATLACRAVHPSYWR